MVSVDICLKITKIYGKLKKGPMRIIGEAERFLKKTKNCMSLFWGENIQNGCCKSSIIEIKIENGIE